MLRSLSSAAFLPPRSATRVENNGSSCFARAGTTALLNICSFPSAHPCEVTNLTTYLRADFETPLYGQISQCATSFRLNLQLCVSETLDKQRDDIVGLQQSSRRAVCSAQDVRDG